MTFKVNGSGVLTANPFNGTIYSIEGRQLYADKIKNLYGHQLKVPHRANTRSRVENGVLVGLDGMMLTEMANYFNASVAVKDVYNLKELANWCTKSATLL